MDNLYALSDSPTMLDELMEHNDIRWITVDQIPNYAFCPADVEIFEKSESILEYKENIKLSTEQ